MSKYDAFRNPGKDKPEVANVGTDTPPTPKPVGPDRSFNGLGKFETNVGMDEVTSNLAGKSLHSGAPDGGGPDPSYAFAKESRGIHDVSAQFGSLKGRSPQRSGGKPTPADANNGGKPID